MVHDKRCFSVIHAFINHDNAHTDTVHPVPIDKGFHEAKISR